MRLLLERLFNEHNFIKQWRDKDVEFYVNKDKNLVSYFIIYYVDCTEFEGQEEIVKETLNGLETRYISFDDKKIALKHSIAKSFTNKNEIAQIDKNTSAIYVMKFCNLHNLNKYRNHIYSIEESTVYFRRYVLPYTEIQLSGLKQMININGKTIETILTELADNENDYYQLLIGANHDSAYELVIRLFAKIPFLQYQFSNTSTKYSLVNMVNSALDEEYLKYDELISEGMENIDKYLDLNHEVVSDDFINSELKKLFGV